MPAQGPVISGRTPPRRAAHGPSKPLDFAADVICIQQDGPESQGGAQGVPGNFPQPTPTSGSFTCRPRGRRIPARRAAPRPPPPTPLGPREATQGAEEDARSSADSGSSAPPPDPPAEFWNFRPKPQDALAHVVPEAGGSRQEPFGERPMLPTLPRHTPGTRGGGPGSRGGRRVPQGGRTLRFPPVHPFGKCR